MIYWGYSLLSMDFHFFQRRSPGWTFLLDDGCLLISPKDIGRSNNRRIRFRDICPLVRAVEKLYPRHL